MFKVIPVIALKDNYIWIIINSVSQRCVIVDPGEAKPVLKAIRDYALDPVAVLITHRHADHTAGIAGILNHFSLPVFAPRKENMSHCIPVEDQEIINLSEIGLTFTTIAIPGHTLGHVAYVASGFLFSGDTLFTGGCGRVFEGSYQEMVDSLQKLKNLAPETLVYCGHEYTEANLTFALWVEPDNVALRHRMQETKIQRQHAQPTVPSTVKVEKETNPFLRLDVSTVIAAAEKHAGKRLASPAEVFEVLREWKNKSNL